MNDSVATSADFKTLVSGTLNDAMGDVLLTVQGDACTSPEQTSGTALEAVPHYTHQTILHQRTTVPV